MVVGGGDGGDGDGDGVLAPHVVMANIQNCMFCLELNILAR